MNQVVGIYKITSPTNKVYIGQSWNIYKRWSDHKPLKVIPGNVCTKLFNSLKKHGVNNHVFEITHELPIDIKQEVLDRYEQIYIDQYRDCGFELLNLKEGGSYGKHAKESIEKMRIKGKENREKLKSNPEEYEKWLNKQRQAKLGKKASDETKKKMSEKRKGIMPSEATLIATRKPKGPMSEETKKKLSEAKKGRPAWNKGMYGQWFGKNLKKYKEITDNNLTNNIINI